MGGGKIDAKIICTFANESFNYQPYRADFTIFYN